MSALVDRPAEPVTAPRPRPRRRRSLRSRRTLPPRPVSHRPPPPPSRNLAIASSALIMLALVSVWILAQLTVLGGFAHARAQDLLYGQFRTQLAEATAPIGPNVAIGRPVAVLTIPHIGVQEVVREGTAAQDLLDGPGHRRDTVLPGQAGVSVVYGRAATYGAPFGHLADLRAGDQIKAVIGQGTVRFTVLGVRRSGDPLPAPAAPGRARLTLVTAAGDGLLSRFTPTDALYVDAEAKKSFPTRPGLAPAVPETERAMASESGALPLLTLDLALLLAVALGVVTASQRWSTALVWTVASPVVLALTWMTTDVAMRLLPNLM